MIVYALYGIAGVAALVCVFCGLYRAWAETLAAAIIVLICMLIVSLWFK